MNISYIIFCKKKKKGGKSDKRKNNLLPHKLCDPNRRYIQCKQFQFLLSQNGKNKKEATYRQLIKACRKIFSGNWQNSYF